MSKVLRVNIEVARWCPFLPSPVFLSIASSHLSAACPAAGEKANETGRPPSAMRSANERLGDTIGSESGTGC
jgi:hypothetical protein